MCYSYLPTVAPNTCLNSLKKRSMSSSVDLSIVFGLFYKKMGVANLRNMEMNMDLRSRSFFKLAFSEK